MQSTNNSRPPFWFRYGIVAVATLMLCSCRATTPRQGGDNALQNASTQAQQGAYQNGRPLTPQHQVMPVIYQQNSNTPPPAARQAEYAAGVRTVCPCGMHGCGPSCGPGCVPSGSCGPQLCAGDCPIVGPRDEYLCDGGDHSLAVAVRKDWKVDGLDQEDTVAHYDTVDGRTVVTPSNQVCIYAPRFGVVRRMVDLHEYARADMPEGIDSPLALSKIDENEEVATSLAQLEPTIHRVEDPASLMLERQQLGELDRDLVVAEYDGLLAPYADLQIVRAGLIDNDETALVARASLAAITWTGDETPRVEINERHAEAAIRDAQPGVVYHTKDPTKPRLRLIKLASCGAAKPGDVVEFTLRFDNIGTQVMGNVTIMDNLTNRLELVEGSDKSSVDADFSTEPNTGGSLVLRWEIKDPIEAGKGGVLQFKCKVR